jgi:hypothetical protein
MIDLFYLGMEAHRPMTSILEELSQRVKQTEAALEKAKEATAEAQAKQATLEEDLEAYTRALQAEERRDGVPGAMRVISAEQVGRPAMVAATTGGREPVNKSEAVRRVLREQKDGISPTDLHSALQKSGVNIGSNYLYALLFKLKKTGSIKKKNRKFYWIERHETKPPSG